MIETFQLTTLAVCCGYVSNLIGRRTIKHSRNNLGVHGLMGFTVTLEATVLKVIQIFLFQPVDNDNLVILNIIVTLITCKSIFLVNFNKGRYVFSWGGGGLGPQRGGSSVKVSTKRGGPYLM